MAGDGAQYPSLSGRGVFVTGGASGIGAAIVSAFADQGSRVATVDIASDSRVPDGVWYMECDVRDTDALQKAITKANVDIGPIRVLVNNAARDDRFDNATMTEAEWDEMQSVNLRHAYFASQAVRPFMAGAGGGSIINFTSPSFLRKDARLVAYATAKAGTIGLTKTLAGDFGPSEIRVNVVMPGWIFTARQRALWVTEETEALVRRETLLPALPTEADVAALVLFLAADDSRMMTAGVHRVDAGWV